MNRAIIMGRLTRDPEVRYTQGDKAMAIARYTLIVGQLSRQIFMPFIMNLVNVCSSHEHTIPFIA